MPIPREMEPVSNRGLGIFLFILSLIVILSVLGLVWLTNAHALDPDFDVNAQGILPGSITNGVSGAITDQSQALQGVTTTLSVNAAHSPDSSPALSSATLGTDGVTWTFVMTHVVQFGAGGNGGWTVATSGQGVITLTYSSGTGTNTLVYQGNKAVGIGETISSGLNYTQPGDGIKDLNGLEMATSGPFAVANNSVTSPFTMSAKGFSSFSASGTIYVCTLTITALGESTNESGGKLFSSFSFDVGSAISDVSLFKSYPSASFVGSAEASDVSQRDAYPSATLQDIGTFLGQSGFVSFPDYTFSILAQILPSYVYLPSLDSTTMAVAGAYASESRYDPQAFLTLAVAGSAVMVSTTGGGGIYYESATMQAFAQSTTSSNAVYGNSITYLVGDYFQYPTFNMPVTFSDIAEMALSNTAIQYPPQRYYLSTISAISVSAQYTPYPTTTYTVNGGFGASTVGQVYAASTSLDITAVSADIEGYALISLPVAMVVDTSAIDNTNQIDWYPLYEYIVSAMLESIYSMGAGEPSTILSSLATFDGISTHMHPVDESNIYSILAALLGESQLTIPDIRAYGVGEAAIVVSISTGPVPVSTSLNSSAAFQSAVVVIRYESISFGVATSISELSSGVQSVSVTLPARAYENSLFRKPTNLFWWMQHRFF